MKKTLKLLASLAFIAITFAMPQITQCMDEKSQENPFGRTLLFKPLTEEKINVDILKYAAAVTLTDGTIGKLSVVCKEWQSFIQQHKIEAFTFAICQVFPVDEKICERFLNGRLIYKPNEDNDNGMIELRIADLVNPLGGTFDLSGCGNTGNDLSISTGYRMGKKPGNADKVEIWFTPRFLVEKAINGNARYFKAIFPSQWQESAPIGIFWTGGWDDMGMYDYLTTQNVDELSNNNLHKKWCSAVQQQFEGEDCNMWPRVPDGGIGSWRFHVHFVSAT